MAKSKDKTKSQEIENQSEEHKVTLERVVTEKSFAKADAQAKYTFYVPLKSNKIEIAKSVENEYDVEVEKVRTLILPGKIKRSLTNRDIRRTAEKKKAIVTLKSGKIKDFTKI